MCICWVGLLGLGVDVCSALGVAAVRVVHSTVVQQHFPKPSLGYACH